MYELLTELTSLCGPCGYEHDVAGYIAKRVAPIVDEVTVDGVGNVVATKRGAYPGPHVVVSTHMDEVGFVIKKIEADGLLRFEKLGGHDDRNLLAQRVKVLTRQAIVEGVIGTISIHMVKFEDASKVRGHRELYIDVGAASRAEVLEMGIAVGDAVTWANPLQRLGKQRVSGKSMDDRAGCAVVIRALEELSADELHGTLTAVFSVQEEVGLRGARVAAHSVQADVAVAIDTTAVSDTPEAPMDDTLSLGAGPCVKVMDFSLITSRAVRERLIDVAKANAIPVQLEVFPGIGTDGGELAMANQGVPTGVISIPSRYTHSPIEVIDLVDLEQTKDLFKAFVTSLRTEDEFRFV
ncbi:M42 family metallopeptidase [Alicyclobacillus sp. ALC3]|nr:M42 family metallopeptidase [Alicyclobacillus sp. ALC3]